MLVRIFSNLVYLLKELGKVIPVADEADDETVSDDIESLQKKLADAQKEVQNAMGEFRSWGTDYYEKTWMQAVVKVKRLEAKILKRKAR